MSEFFGVGEIIIYLWSSRLATGTKNGQKLETSNTSPVKGAGGGGNTKNVHDFM